MAGSYDFTGKTVVVTGASRGIGFGVAQAFAAAGADVVIFGRRDVDEAKQRIEENIRDLRGVIRAVCCDIVDRDAVAETFANIPHIDILVNNAGLERITPLDDQSDETADVFRQIVETNVLGTYHVTRSALPKIPDGGRIIITASIWSKIAVAEFSAYCSTKHANLGLMRSWARELAPRKIAVNAVCPGWVKTDAAMLSLQRMSERSGRPEKELLAEITGAQAFNGLMAPDDVAAAYLFLASDAANDITGQALNVDRGEVMV